MIATYIDNGTQSFELGGDEVNHLLFAIEIFVALFLVAVGIKYRRFSIIALTLIQTASILIYEISYSGAVRVHATLFCDQFSLIMALIIGVIGSLICLYSLDYMRSFHYHHLEISNRLSLFFALLFIFLSAMFGLIFSNSLIWIFFFWEITTLCSFLLIGYTQTEEAQENAFKALRMNLLGGVAFTTAILFLATRQDPFMGLDELLRSGESVSLIPAALLSIAALTKSAQFPFSSWLVGAMVAPTPVSALLHSSAMVKAGVYLVIRVSPLLVGMATGYAVAAIGAITFLIASSIAISKSNAKELLAYSTIANLGLIVACAGIGTPEAIWAGIFLILFHAISKALLFIAVGTVEETLSSRNIEDMWGLITKMPLVTTVMVIGMAGMFLAPFGMLISKWMAIEAFIKVPHTGVLFVLILAFGSALTLFFWVKWMGTILTLIPGDSKIDKNLDWDQKISFIFLAGLTMATCFLFPLISSWLLDPFLSHHYGKSITLGQGNSLIMILMLSLILVLLLSTRLISQRYRKIPQYMAGLTLEEGRSYIGSLGIRQRIEPRNYYLERYFGEESLVPLGFWISAALIVLILILSLYTGVIV